MGKKQEIQRRYQRIGQLLCDGVKRAEIINTIAEEDEISPRTAERSYYEYIKSVSETFEDNKDEYAVMALEWVVLSAQIAKDKDSAKGLQDAAKELRQLVGIGEKGPESERKLPEFITLKEKDFSGLQVVSDDKAVNDE